MVTSPDPSVAVIIVNFNDASNTLAAVASVATSIDCAPYIIVVDNGSTDGSVDVLQRCPQISQLIRSPVNGGFTHGNNLGFHAARQIGCRYAFLLNNDATVESRTIAVLLSEMESNPAIAAVSPEIRFFDHPELIWFCGSRFIPWLAYAAHVGWRRPSANVTRHSGPIPLFTGCAVLLRTAAFEGGTLFDAALFGYAEDLDTSILLTSAGWQITLRRDSLVYHKEGVGYKRAGGQSLRTYLSARNLLQVSWRHTSGFARLPLVVGFFLNHVVRFVMLASINRDLAAIQGTLLGTLHGISGGHHPIEPRLKGRPNVVSSR